MGALRRAAVDGDVEYGSLMAGQSVGLMDNIIGMEELIKQLLCDANNELLSVKKRLA